MTNLTESIEWQALIAHYNEIKDQHMRDWFAHDTNRFARFSLSLPGLLLDYSRNRIQSKTLALLLSMVETVGLSKKIDDLFSGKPVNVTENRAALHTALRDKKATSIMINGKNIAPAIAAARQQMTQFTHKIHAKEWRGRTGKPIAHLINIGIGGSHLGPLMTIHALADFAVTNVSFHFISSVDRDHLNETLQQIDPETALFIISSKTFSTLETMTNAHTIRTWMQNRLGQAVLKNHFIAITAAPSKALSFGIPEEHILPLWDWVGGRYSIWSTIGFPLMVMIGPKQFDAFLAGAFQMDEHFRQSAFEKNMPVILALLSIWYLNFFNVNVQAIAAYPHRLIHFIPYLQQAEMESNGKSINLKGQSIIHTTGPVIFGGDGCNGQHAYHQLLHQGRHLIPVDFILTGQSNQFADDPHQDILIASGLSQAQALLHGKDARQAFDELLAANHSEEEAKQLATHLTIPGNRPSNILFMNRITPTNLGMLLALYEHKIFVQAAIWDINSFDQWGVELGKQLLPRILHQIQGKNHDFDPTTVELLTHFKKMREMDE